MTLRTLLENGAGGTVALSAPDRPSLSYDQLRAHIDTIGQQLAGQG